MVATNDGFKIAEKDLEIRGPGEIEGTRQSGALNFKLASIVADKTMLEVARTEVENILNAHKNGLPAVNLHCAMHSYRLPGKDDWFQFVGIQSAAHGPQKPIEITFIEKDHPVTKTLENWTTINEELYNNLKLFPTAKPLARGRQDTGSKVDDYVVTWTNQYGKGRVFSTTIGHNSDTVGDPRYLDMVTRGLLWSCDKLNPEYLQPLAGAKKVPAAQ